MQTCTPVAAVTQLIELHRPGRAVLGEDPLAAAEQDGLDHQVELVDQPLPHQRLGQAGAAPDQQVTAVLAPQRGDVADGIVGR